jgi:hypothetical protein
MTDVSIYDTRNYLLENNYIIVDGFLSEQEANDLYLGFKYYATANPDKFTQDDQCPKSLALYDYMPFVQLLVDRVPVFASIVKEPVLPTYCYARLYKHGEELHRHTDRESCELSATVHLGSDGTDWPIYFTDPRGKEVEVILKPGQAAVYLGMHSEHWRNKFEGQEYGQVFLHYVRTYGENSDHYFDRITRSNG